MKSQKNFHNYVYGVRFLVETDANTLVHQPNLPANDPPGARVTHWIAWIWLLDFNTKHIPGRLNGYPDGDWRWPWGEGEPKLDVEDDQEETIEATLRGIWTEQRAEHQRR